MRVHCPECGEDHNPEEVVFVGIEEDIHGRDLLAYVCPVTGKETKALVTR
jgi:hypothetical protein